jgi:hypothetical protein
MAKGNIVVGSRVSYLSAAGRWKSAVVTTVSSQTSLILAIVLANRTRSALNGGVAVAKRTTGTQTNVWRKDGR